MSNPSILRARTGLALKRICSIVLYPTIMIAGGIIFLVGFVIANIYAVLAYLTGSTSINKNQYRIIEAFEWPMEWAFGHLDRLLKI